MTPNIYTGFAIKVHPVRWMLIAAIFAVITLAWVLIFTSVAPGRLALGKLIAVAVPLVAVLWAGAWAAFWFHPDLGRLSDNRPALRRLPQSARTILRWYAAVFLNLCVVAVVGGALVFAGAV
ncbi:hypothetical protein [Paracidovorax sp. MALMAid1276]|uniref:hypothetical protein n=1 Tax=Paracidovorax sp. MALMAid1276 TaxID=3411631 RepID=UPI003B9B975F